MGLSGWEIPHKSQSQRDMTQSLSTPQQQTSLTRYTFIMYQIYHL